MHFTSPIVGVLNSEHRAAANNKWVRAADGGGARGSQPEGKTKE